MFRKPNLIPSQSMGRKMYVWQYGHYGYPILVFPSAAGMAHEWENHGMIETLAELLDGGRIKLYCVESNVSEAWTRKESDPAWRLSRHRLYEQFILNEMVPFIRDDCRSPDIKIAASGCSLGAFYSANFALKRPDIFNYALCMSGRYDTSQFLNGFSSQDSYFNNPMAYVPNMHGEGLAEVRKGTHLSLVCGQGKWEDGNHEEASLFASTLASRGISHELDLWGLDVAHDWTWWRRQALLHLTRRFAE